MRGVLNFAKTTALGGLVFLLPLILIAAVVAKAVELMLGVSEPLSQMAPIAEIGGIAVATVLALVLVILLCFVAGLIARTALALRFKSLIERKVLDGVPFYAFLKGMIASVIPSEQAEQLKPVLVRYDDCSEIGFEIERTADGSVVVFSPNAPNPWSGAVKIVSADRITALKANVLQSLRVVQQLGVGAKALLDRPAPRS